MNAFFLFAKIRVIRGYVNAFEYLTTKYANLREFTRKGRGREAYDRKQAVVKNIAEFRSQVSGLRSQVSGLRSQPPIFAATKSRMT